MGRFASLPIALENKPLFIMWPTSRLFPCQHLWYSILTDTTELQILGMIWQLKTELQKFSATASTVE